MTIPIIPGKFDFLANLGRAGGLAARSAEEQRRFEELDARAKQEFLLNIRKNEIAVSEAERNAGIRDQFANPDPVAIPIPSLGFGGIPTGVTEVEVPGPGPSDRERILAGLPTRAQRAADKLAGKKAEEQARIIREGSPGARAEVLGTTDEQTLALRNERDRDLQLNSLATRSVNAAITLIGGNIREITAEGGKGVSALVEAAWEIAQQDAKSAGYVANEELTKTYIQSEIRAQGIREEELDIARERARTGAFGRNRDAALARATSFQRQAEGWRKLLNDLKEPDTTARAMHSVILTKISVAQEALGPNATGEQLQAAKDAVLSDTTDPSISLTRGFYEDVESYNRLKADYESRAAASLRQFQEAMSEAGQSVASPGAADPQKRLTPEAVEQAAVALVQQAPSNWQAVLNNYVAQQVMSQTDADAIRSQIEVMQRRGVTVTPTGGTP